MIRNLIVIFFVYSMVFNYNRIIAQPNTIDSLLGLVNSNKKDTSAVIVYSNLCWAYLNESEHNKALEYGEKGLKLATEINFKYGALKCYKNLGSVYALMADYDKALSYYNNSLKIAEEINNKTEMANCYGNIGNIYYYKSDFTKALLFYEKQLKIVEEMENAAGMARCYNNIGSLYTFLNNYPKALGYYLKKIKLSKKLKDDDLLAGAYTNMGILYEALKINNKAEEYYQKAIEIYEKRDDKRNCAMIYLNFGNLSEKKNNYQEALEFHERSLKIAMVINDKELISKNLNDIGLIYMHEGKTNKALDNFLEALKINQEIDDLYGIGLCYINIGSIYRSEGDIKKGIEYFNKALEIGEQIGAPDILRGAYLNLSESNFKIENFKQAYLYHVKLKEVNDSVFNVENSKILGDLKTNFEVEKIESELKAKAEAQQLINVEEKKRQQFVIYAVAGILIIVIVFSALLFKRFRLTNKQKKIIELKEQETQKQNIIISEQKYIVEEKHKEITDSINYAERIQRSFLATKELLDENLLSLRGIASPELDSGKQSQTQDEIAALPLVARNEVPDYFVFFKPKDIVSGDFYWAASTTSTSSVTAATNKKFILVTADSTGHGVPGAIMSLLNITSLESAIKDGLTEPSDILNATRKTIIERLKKDGSSEGGKDGMDCSLTMYDFETKKLVVAAAHNPVWIMRKKVTEALEVTFYEIIEVKPDKMPVGKHDRQDVSFTQQEIQLQPGDLVYTLTDGFPDQFGGEKGKKFMSKNLRELLATNAHLPMNEQKELLETTFANWVGEMEQVDDITVIGIRI